VLRAPYELIAESLPNNGGDLNELASGFLARVCELHLYSYTSVDVSDVARVLHAAPHLRTLC
jgi:hypothetical protein